MKIKDRNNIVSKPVLYLCGAIDGWEALITVDRNCKTQECSIGN